MAKYIKIIGCRQWGWPKLSRGKSHVIQDDSLLQSTPNPSFANSFCIARRVSKVFFLELKDFLPAWIVTRLSSQFHLDGKLNNVTLCAASWAEMPLALLSPNTQYTPLLTFFWRYVSLSEEVSSGNGAGSALRSFQTNEPLVSIIITDALEGVSSEQ